MVQASSPNITRLFYPFHPQGAFHPGDAGVDGLQGCLHILFKGAVGDDDDGHPLLPFGFALQDGRNADAMLPQHGGDMPQHAGAVEGR